jgi:hypothetical protein
MLRRECAGAGWQSLPLEETACALETLCLGWVDSESVRSGSSSLDTVTENLARAYEINSQESIMDTTTLLLIVIVLLVLFGGGYYGRRRWF